MAHYESSCVFCGARAVRSRVLPSWLDRVFPDDPPLAAQRSLTCGRCDRGWLGDLERRAMPLIESMSAGLVTTLATAEQETVALWGAKTILMLQAIREPDQLPLADCREMYESLLPPAGTRVAIALRAREGRWPYRFAMRGSASELCVGQLVIRANARGSAAVEIWPSGGTVSFPPPQGLVRAA